MVLMFGTTGRYIKRVRKTERIYSKNISRENIFPARKTENQNIKKIQRLITV